MGDVMRKNTWDYHCFFCSLLRLGSPVYYNFSNFFDLIFRFLGYYSKYHPFVFSTGPICTNTGPNRINTLP